MSELRIQLGCQYWGFIGRCVYIVGKKDGETMTKKPSPKHSPLPWKVDPPFSELEKDHLYIDLVDARGNCLANFHNSFHGRRAIKEAIRAVNSHAEAMEAITALLKSEDAPSESEEQGIKMSRAVEAAQKFQKIDKETK